MSGLLKFGLIGHNIGYSKSADIFKAIFEITGMNGSFENFDLEPFQFKKQFQTVLDHGASGLSVTIPFKSKVISILNDVTAVARSLDAVNSISIKNDKLYGDNTDIIGFALPLKLHASLLKKSHALILGCGGSARAAVYSLHTDYEISEFTVLGRSAEKLEEFKGLLNRILLNATISNFLWNGFSIKSSTKFAIAVNCTPLGGWNYPDECPFPNGFKWDTTQIVYDLNYNSDNQVVVEASKNKVLAIDGSQMLVGQAIRSFEIWTGETVSFDEVYGRVFGRTTTLPD